MNKKTIILGGILVTLIALAYTYQGPLKEWQARLGKSKNFLAKIDVNQIDKIEITRKAKITMLEKQDGKWKINGTKEFFIEDGLASSLKSGLEEAIKSKAELVSSNKDNKQEFQTDESGSQIKLYQEEMVLADFVVGKMASDYISAYISEPESNNTYAIKANLFSLFNREDWHDKTIFNSAKEGITKIRFQYPNREFSVEKMDGKWAGTIPYKFSVSEEKINKILDIMSNLTAAEIPDQIFANTGLEKHLMIVQATGEGIDNALMIGEANENELYFAKRGDSDNIYLITKEQRDELEKRIWQLR